MDDHHAGVFLVEWWGSNRPPYRGLMMLYVSKEYLAVDGEDGEDGEDGVIRAWGWGVGEGDEAEVRALASALNGACSWPA